MPEQTLMRKHRISYRPYPFISREISNKYVLRCDLLFLVRRIAQTKSLFLLVFILFVVYVTTIRSKIGKCEDSQEFYVGQFFSRKRRKYWPIGHCGAKCNTSVMHFKRDKENAVIGRSKSTPTFRSLQTLKLA